MNRLRLSDAREEVAIVAGGCAVTSTGTTHPDIRQLINEACRRLAVRGKWVGTVQRYRINVTSAIITWPRQVAAIEAVAFCNEPGEIRNEWYEFLGHGPGLLDCDSCPWYSLIDRDPRPVIAEITSGATNRKLRVYADVEEDADAYITVQGYDENGNWIKTQDDDDNWIDGERIALSTTPVLSTKFFKYVAAVFKPVTNGFIRVYEYNNTSAANVRVLGYYEPDETNPMYRRSLIPGGTSLPNCGECETPQVTVAVKLQFIPARNDDDWLMLGNLDAIKLAVQAILKERANLQGEAEGYWGKALRELQVELAEYKGDGAVPVLRIAANFGGGGIPIIY